VQLVVGRIGRAHGIHGDVTVEVRTDDPERRLAPGEVLVTEPGAVGPLTVSRQHWHSGRLLLGFAEVADRTAAEALRGTFLLTDVDPDEAPEDDAWYDFQLVGLTVTHVDGTALGRVTDVVHLPAQDLLAVDIDGREVLVPFVAEIVPAVDLAAGVVTVDPPGGLLDEAP